MRIKKLSIKNLGKHKHLEAILDGSVVGLMGANGSGKSTILKIIHFLVTGWTPAKETQESFVRKVDPELEEEPTHGIAEMEFYAQGNTYRISRKIGSTSTRKLTKLDAKGDEIKEDTYTRADEIQSALTDILGADKYAIDNAVFPEQGALDKILFGSQAEREELLVKLLLLGHMQKVADVAAGKIKVLSSEIQDFSTLHDELQSSRNTVEQDLASSEYNLTRTRSYDSEIALHDAWTRLNEELDTNADHIRALQNSATNNSNKYQDILRSQADKLSIELNSIEELDDWVNKLKTKIKTTRNVVLTVQDTKNRAIEYNNHVDQINKHLDDLKDLQSECPAEVNPADIRKLEEKIKLQDKRKQAATEVEEAANKGKEAKTNVAKFTALADQLSNDLNKIEDDIKTLSNEASLYKTITDTCKLALHSEKSCTADCPVCGKNLDYDKLQDRFDTYNTKLTEATTKLSLMTANRQSIITESRKTQTALNENQTLLNLYVNKYKDNKAVLDSIEEQCYVTLTNQLNSLNSKNAVRATMLSSINRLDTEIKRITKILSGYSDEDKSMFASIDVKLLDKDIKDLNEKIDHLASRLEELESTYASVNKFKSAADAESTRAREIIDKCNALTIKRDEVYNTFPDHLQRMVGEGGDIKAQLREKNREYTELQAKTKQLKVQADGIKSRLREIEAKIKLDEDKRNVIGELQRVVTAFSRQGIPMAYVQHKFDSLVSMTQENLEIMDANFAIIPHPTKPVSLQFYRVDEPGQVLFDHDKLSGGQKVRMSIAFLLAVQQLVIPDLGFLVLDEPSTHLDEEARENLKELLLNLSQQLETTDTQILVCDHARELEPAFVNVIQL